MQIAARHSLETDLSLAATTLRATRAAYRDAILSGDLRAAIDLRQRQVEAEVRLEAARFLIEGCL